MLAAQGILLGVAHLAQKSIILITFIKHVVLGARALHSACTRQNDLVVALHAELRVGSVEE